MESVCLDIVYHFVCAMKGNNSGNIRSPEKRSMTTAILSDTTSEKAIVTYALFVSLPSEVLVFKE